MSDKISFVYEIRTCSTREEPARSTSSSCAPGVPVTPQTCLKDRPAAARRAFVKTVAESAGVWRLIEQKRCTLLSWLWHRQRPQSLVVAIRFLTPKRWPECFSCRRLGLYINLLQCFRGNIQNLFGQL